MKYLRTVQLVSFLLLFIAAGFSAPIQAQEAVQYLLEADQSRLWIDGTSNRDDWTVHANEFQGVGSFSGNGSVDQLTVTVAATQVLSNSNRIMDRLITDALKARQHDTITYALHDAASVQTSSGSTMTLRTTGGLTLAGVTNEVEIEVQAERLDGGAVRFTGSMPLNMTDYDMTPPTAMFGALRTGADVTIHFDVVFAPSS